MQSAAEKHKSKAKAKAAAGKTIDLKMAEDFVNKKGDDKDKAKSKAKSKAKAKGKTKAADASETGSAAEFVKAPVVQVC